MFKLDKTYLIHNPQEDTCAIIGAIWFKQCNIYTIFGFWFDMSNVWIVRDVVRDSFI